VLLSFLALLNCYTGSAHIRNKPARQSNTHSDYFHTLTV
jgi:hypothetical protein